MNSSDMFQSYVGFSSPPPRLPGPFRRRGEGVGITSQGDERLQPRRNAWCPSAFFTLLRLSRYDLKHPQVVLKLLQCTLLCVVRLKVP